LLGNVQGKVCFVTLHQYQLQYVIEMKCQYWQKKKNLGAVEVCFTRAVSEYKLLDHQYNADKELEMVAVNTRLRECQITRF
jgi:hypothetical protein